MPQHQFDLLLETSDETYQVGNKGMNIKVILFGFDSWKS